MTDMTIGKVADAVGDWPVTTNPPETCGTCGPLSRSRSVAVLFHIWCAGANWGLFHKHHEQDRV